MLTIEYLGFKVCDVVSGLEGIATSWHENFSGVDQVGISAPAKDGTLPDPMCFDIQQVEVTAPTPSISRIPAPPHQFHLGDQVKDNITGFVGKITSLSTFLNGCVYALIQPESKKNEWPEKQSLSVMQLTLVKAAATPAEKPKRGGPAQRVMR